MDIDVPRLLGGRRRELARALTLIESSAAADREKASQLIEQFNPTASNSIRIAISGPPGAGKSTLIDALGMHLLGLGRRPAVLAIDPSSPLGGGSVLGDKTRMPQLASDPRAFVRPSSAEGHLGGVTNRTRESIAVCEAAGFDTVIVETVGVGQTECEAYTLVDFFVLLVPPAAGDDLQGMKSGILEVTDLLVVSKADGPLLPVARKTAADYGAALRGNTRTGIVGTPGVHLCSSVEGVGIAELWHVIESEIEQRCESGEFGERRRRQAAVAVDRAFEAVLQQRLAADERFQEARRQLHAQVAAGELSQHEAARRLADVAVGLRARETV